MLKNKSKFESKQKTAFEFKARFRGWKCKAQHKKLSLKSKKKGKSFSFQVSQFGEVRRSGAGWGKMFEQKKKL